MNDDLVNRFTYHAPTDGQPQLYEQIRGKALEYARFIDENTPRSREQSLAITHLEEVVFWANASVARSGG